MIAGLFVYWGEFNMEKPKELDVYINRIREKYKGNISVTQAILDLDSDDYIEEFINDDKSFTNQEFIDILAIKRRAGYSKSSGGGNNAAEEQVAKLYEKNPWKFVEEFLQNADDCIYNEDAFVNIVIDEKDNSIEFIYNEVGFSRSDIWGITAFSQSTKTENADYTEDQISDYFNEIAKQFEGRSPEDGAFYYERTGRKGIGFKAVFSLKAQNVLIHISSNGYSFTLDNQIGTAVPIWNEENLIDDGLTHVKVQLVNPEFSVEEIYEKFEKLFCINDSENLFSSCPALFMHKIKHVNVICKASQNNYVFDVKLSDIEKPVYAKEINIDAPVLSAIYHEGKYYREIIQHINITRKSDEGAPVITEAVKLTINEKVEGIFRNFSIIAPVLKSKSEEVYTTGSLFRTFPMSDNKFNIPLAIDAPFDLNQSRSGLQYSANSKYNQIISDCIFKEDGIFETIMYKLRDGFECSIFEFIPDGVVELFRNDENTGYELVEIVDLTALLSSYPLFRKFFNNNEFISYNDAIQLDKEIYSWPLFEFIASSFSSLLGDNLISEDYSNIEIRIIKLYDDSNFSIKINEYLELLEGKLSVEDFYEFIFHDLITYINKNIDDISQDSLQTLNILVFDVIQNCELCKCRESYNDKYIYLFTDGEERLSVNKYRIIYDDTPVANLINSMKINAAIDFNVIFHDYGENENIKVGETWGDIKDFIEASLEYGFDISHGELNYNKIVFSSNIDPEFNLFRESGTCDIIPDEDIENLSRYFDNDTAAVVRLIRDTGMSAKELYSKANGILKLSPSTVSALKKIDDEYADAACELLIKSFEDKEEHSINIGFDECKSFNKKIMLCIFRNEYYFSRDNLKAISRNFLSTPDFLNESDPELIIRALVLSEQNEYTNAPENYSISITIQEVIENGLVDRIRHIINVMKCDFIEISNDGCFEEIDSTEIWPLLEKAEYNRKKPEDIKFYKSVNIPDDKGNRPFLADGREENVYLNVDNSGDFKRSLSKYLNRKFDSDYLKYYNLMTRSFEQVRNQIISPVFIENLDMDSAYKKIREDFSEYSKKDIISIISWFSNQGYADVVSGGKSNEKEINEDYIESPWKFVYEFIQNVDDCSFSSTDLRNLRIILDKDNHSISFEYNEDGFTLEDIEAITRFNQSNKNKEDNKYKLEHSFNRDGVIILNETGRKGRGFKSVFSLPDDDIKVKITSNGFNFEFFKKLGYSIPVWFENDANNKETSGTIVKIEALSDETIDVIAKNLRRLFSFDEFENVFSSCPSLFLRNLEKISVIDSDKEYSVELTKIDDGEYSECIETPFLDNVNGVIRRDGKYYRNLIEKYSLVLRNSVYEEDVVIPVVKCSEMVTVDYRKKNEFQEETNVVSVIVPIIELESSRKYVKGCLFQTLPLEGEAFDLPLAINAEFETDSGRSHVNIHNDKSKVLINEILYNLLEKLYNYLREIDNINIVAYLKKNTYLFKNDEDNKIKIGERINEFDVLRLNSGNGFGSAKQAVILHGCTDWPFYDYLYQCFSDAANEKDTLIDPGYIKQKIDVQFEIRLFSVSGFVERLNRYLDYIEMQSDVNIAAVLNEHVYPYLNNHISSIEDQYYRIGKNLLGDLKVFIFENIKGEYFRESLSANTCWIRKAPSGKKSCGIFRPVEQISCDWNENQNWISAMMYDCGKSILDFSNAFTTDSLESFMDDTWETTKQIIESLIYYEANGTGNKISLSFLRKCIYDEAIESADNVYLKAFDALNRNKILKHVITESDIDEICVNAGLDISDKNIVITGISTLGILKNGDFFEIDRKTGALRLNDEIVAVLSMYCTTQEKADEVVSAIEVSLNEDPHKAVFEILYSDIKDCSSCVMLSILNTFEKLKHIEDLAAEYYNNKLPYSIEDKLTILLCSKYMKSEDFKCERRMSFDYPEIVDKSLGIYLRDYNYNEKLVVDIRMNSEFKDYEGNAVNEALSWMNDDASKGETTHFSYYQTDLSNVFEDKYKIKYIFDSTKVILDNKDPESALLNFTRNVLKSEDDAVLKNLIDISIKKHKLTTWSVDTGSKKDFVSELSKYRKQNAKTISILLTDNIVNVINDASSNPTEYIIAELLQNINDCLPFADDEERILKIELDESNGIMKLKYNEAGFSFANVYSITGIGQSTKHDKSEGEKGLGFKKVFKVFDRVNVLSNEFYFTLSADKDELTSINWDESSKAEYEEGYTTMIFFIRKGDEFRNEFRKLITMWKKFFERNYLDSTISPLFLENIKEYHCNLSSEVIKREDILENYYYHKISIMDYYKGIVNILPNKLTLIEEAYSILKTRTKCQYMTEKEQTEYIDSLEIAVCIPRKPDESKCYFYSTLKTEERSHISVNINIPFELSTARDAIMRDSEYNKKLNEIIFSPVKGMRSMFGRILQDIVHKEQVKNFWTCISGDIKEFISFFNTSNENDKIEDIKNWNIFDPYKKNIYVSLNQGYSVEEIIYRYLHEVDESEIRTDFIDWIKTKKCKRIESRVLIDIQTKYYSRFDKLANSLGLKTEGIYPLVENPRSVALLYFKDEYEER